MRYILNILILLFSCCMSFGAAKSAQDYFSAGNEAYRRCDYPHAMLNYERALKLAPLNDDVRHNIEITRGKTIDRMPAEGEVVFVRWYKGLVMSLNTDVWAYTSLICLALALLLYLCYLFVDNLSVRKVSFYTSALLSIMFIFTTSMAWLRSEVVTKCNKGVIMAEMVTVKSSPTMKSAETCIIHEGTVVKITDRDLMKGKLSGGKAQGWVGIALSDGREGWIEANTLEEI
jgi:hypothetical protein